MMLDVMESPYQKALDGPARRLLCELGRLHRTDRYEFYASLDREADDREETHAAELAAAAAEHEQVRKNAESTRSWMEMKLNAERLERERWETEEREEAKRKYQEALEREREERQRKEERLIVLEAEKARHAEFAARKQALAEREGRKSEEAKRLVDKQRADDAKTASEKKDAGRQTAEAENKAKEATITVANASPESNPLSAVIERSKLNLESPSLDPRKEAEHRKYLQVHQRLKQLRKYLLEEAKQNRALKNRMGDSRRNIKKCVGQYLIGVEDIKSSEVLGGEKEVNDSNKRATTQIINTLKSSLEFMQPEVDVTMFLVSPPTEIGSTKGPALLLYLLNILAKAIISQFISEASVSPKSADPVGIMGSTMFAQEDFRWNGFSLVDILIAKFHVVCPVLFGIYGDEATSEGKRRLGWTREEKTGHWVSGQRHFERMTGLGAGYAAIALRNFDNSRHENPFPPYHFWTTLASITNVPAAEVTSTHFAVLKAMIENNEQRILQFFGDGGIMALRAALIEFPRRVGFNSSAAKAVAILTDVLRKDKKIFL